MSNIALSSDPIHIIGSSIEGQDIKLKHKFLSQIKHLYQYQIFKPLLDLAATKIALGQLKFKIHESRFFDLDHGNCKTIIINEGKFNTFLRKINLRKQYCITIKNVAAEVIVHEIAHMVEQEAKGFNLAAFTNIISTDIKKAVVSNPSLAQALNHIFTQQVSHYAEDQKSSELFARFFQIFAAAKEVAFNKAESYAYNLTQVASVLDTTISYVNNNLISALQEAIDINIARLSTNYIKELSKIEEKWADRRTQSIHGAHSGSNLQWRQSIKSIKSDPFQ